MRRKFRLIAAFSAFSSIAACAPMVPVSRIEAAEGKWNAAGIQNYQYTLEVGSLAPFTECSPDRRIEVDVRNGKPAKFGTCDVDSKLALQFGSVERFFSTIRAHRRKLPPHYTVRFHSSLGYPEVVDANFSAEATDYKFRYTIDNFRANR